MTQTRSAGVPGQSTPDAPAPPPVRPVPVTGVYLVAGAAAVLLAAVHLTQGTSSIGVAELLRLLVGDGEQQTASVLVASRLPRMLALVVVGVALEIASAALRSIAVLLVAASVSDLKLAS